MKKIAVLIIAGFIAFVGAANAETFKAVIVEGNSLFSGTYAPQDKPFEKPYAEDELANVNLSAERNSKIFLLDENGVLYYPCPKKGVAVSESTQSERIHRIFTPEQQEIIDAKKKKLFTWTTLTQHMGEVMEITGEIYPGYGGIKGVYIESVLYADMEDFK